MAHSKKRSKSRRVIGGVDTHSQTHHAAVVLASGKRLADAQFPTTRAGQQQLLSWLRSFGRLHTVGIEGTGSYGAGLTRHLRQQQVTVVEVNQPDRQQRRMQGKSDPLDAYAAAEAVLAQRARATPKAGTGPVEALRALHTTRASALKARTAAINELRSHLVTAPTALRDQLRGLTTTKLITTCAELQPTGPLTEPTHAVTHTLRSLARRYQHLTDEITDLTHQLTTLLQQTYPHLLALHGLGVDTATQLLITCGDNPDRITSEASFAALCGAAPLPASSGTTHRHRLNRGGDRQANRALHAIAITRMATCPTTRAYVTRRTAEGRTKRDILRCLKRYIARQTYNTITTTHPTPP